ncbi:hypothetical protein Cgig2_013822 [Carnegiea gigantea]|uniref:Uncharacterized protein n=1 Tax=Carnegiea gigantea TaxID=171969 RepID=A0A9Q1JWX1_9CARY|nr:hypothetical protein Cgig2_013822 [Carnegiea gigantea]
MGRKVNHLLEAFALMLESVEVKVEVQILTKLRQHIGVATRGPDFTFNVIEYIKCEKDVDYFVDDEERVVNTFLLYTLARSSSQKVLSPHHRLPKMIVVKWGNVHTSSYNNQLLQALAKLSIDIVRPYRSQHQVPPEIAEKWGFFKVLCLRSMKHI